MPKFEFNRGKMRSLESIAYLDAIERGEEPERPSDSIQPPARPLTVAESVELADDATDEADGLKGMSSRQLAGQKAAATRAANRAAKLAAIAEPLRPTNIDPETGETVLLREVIDPETGEVSQEPVEQTADEKTAIIAEAVERGILTEALDVSETVSVRIEEGPDQNGENSPSLVLVFADDRVITLPVVDESTGSAVADTLNAISAENAEASDAVALATAPNQAGE